MKEKPKRTFKTPEGYFENFNERLLDRMAKEESIIPKEDGFTVPEGYFEKLPEKINARLSDDNDKVVRLNPSNSHPNKKFYYIAAAIAAIVVLALTLKPERGQEIDFSDLASNDIIEYLENNDLGLSTYEIAEALPIDNMAITDGTKMPLEEENILQYLDENIDMEDVEELNLDYDDFE